MKKLFFVAAASVILTGCNMSDDEAGKVAKETNGYKCDQQRVLGSMIPKKVCSTAAQRKEAEQRSKEAARDARRAVTLNGVESQ